MIESITMRGVASYSSSTSVTIDTNKKIVCFYGHNGTGKSTLTRYLHGKSPEQFTGCSHVLQNPHEYQIVVYNNEFIEDNFAQDVFSGVFTLGEKNVAAEQAVANATNAIQKIESDRDAVQLEIKTLEESKKTSYKDIKNSLFKTKQTYDRSDLDHCLIGYKNDAGKFYQKVISTSPLQSPDYSFADLAAESKELNDDSVQAKTKISSIVDNVSPIESNPIFQEVIIGTGDSYLVDLVTKLQNSTWIDDGRIYIEDSEGNCPFCQQTLTDEIVQGINALFDSAYDDKKSDLNDLLTRYQSELSTIEQKFSQSEFSCFADSVATEKLIHTLQSNVSQIEQKVKDPSKKVLLMDTSNLFATMNHLIDTENEEIDKFNAKLSSKSKALEHISEKFWRLVRNLYESDIQTYNSLIATLDSDIDAATKLEEQFDSDIASQKVIISENRKKITNIEESIIRINAQMKAIGMEGFEIKNTDSSTNNYYLCRGTSASGKDVYKSLSEGEKTLITYLYFLELCSGSVDSQSSIPKTKKIVVIDDPISSLSHNYIYEIGALTHRKLIKGYSYAQVILLTHSLYFLHEMIKYLPKGKDQNGDSKFDKKCNLFRVTKNSVSNIVPMRESDVKNDYQSYWQVIKDAAVGNVNSVVMPNMMRNVLEYYFSFIHKTEQLGVALEELEETDAEFKPFYRYINRESHSDSININDLAEIDSSRFIEKFRDVFVRTKFLEHYEKMMA